MIIGNRRLRLLYLALAAMDMAVLLPWLSNIVSFWARNGDTQSRILEVMLAQSPLLIFLVLWALMIFYMWTTDLLNRWQITGGLYYIAILALLAVTSILLVRLLLYPTSPLYDFRWLRETIYSVVNLVGGIRGEILIIVTNYLLWMRIARYTDRSLTFFAVGLSFRLGMLLIVIGSALLAYWSGENSAAIIYLILFFSFGLAAVALSRIDNKAMGSSNSSGALLPWDRFAQLVIMIVALLGTATAAATIYTPQTLRTVLSWFSPVGYFLQWALSGAVFALFWVLTPLLEWIMSRLQDMIAQSEPLPLPEQIATPEPLTLMDAVQEFAMLRYCIAATVIFIALSLILIFFVRMTRRERTSEDEETSTEAGLRPEGFRLGWDRLKDWFALLGRYGIGSQLLAAISVENIYANLTRIARRQGFPRHPAQGPDRYLPTLLLAFPGYDAELNAITAAYIRVRYAEKPISAEELAELRIAYDAITAPKEAGEGGQARTT